MIPTDQCCSPCFAGSSYATGRCNPTIRHHRVAVLVLLEVRMQLSPNTGRTAVRKELQSLFCWKFVCNPTKSSRAQELPRSCSPCFAGSSYATGCGRCWRRLTAPRGCSPCFAGSSYATSYATIRALSDYLLQSLFCWKFVCNFRARTVGSSTVLLQSLFCWKFVCNRSTYPRRTCRGSTVAVLVLLEVRMQQEIVKRMSRRFPRLQSLFCWKFVCNKMEKTDSKKQEIGLQSLFCWKFVCNLGFPSITNGIPISCSPCFAGSSYATTYEITGYEVIEKLQSLFCWKFVCNKFEINGYEIMTKVAVLVLLEVRMQQI